jgi:hypothetical protein
MKAVQTMDVQEFCRIISAIWNHNELQHNAPSIKLLTKSADITVLPGFETNVRKE